LHVRTVEPELELCAPTIGIEDACELRMFVEPKFLRPVVIRPTQQLLDDGTRLALRPGTPVDGPGPEAIAHVLGAAITVALDEADVGRWYMPSAYTRPPADESLVYLGEALRYGEHTLSTFGWRSPTVTAERMIEGQRLLSFDNACGSFDLLVEEAEPAADDGAGRYAIKGPKDAIPQMAGKFDPDMLARNAGILGVLSQSVGDPTPAWAGCLPARWTVAAQTRLRWPDGGAAGLTRLEIKLDAEPEVRQEQACFPISTEIQVCADAAKVVHHERDDCPQLGPGAGTGGLTPQIQQGNATITGNLNGDIIRRIVRAHVNEVRSCYEQGLTNNPGLHGTVVISFEITTTGEVSSAKVDSTELTPNVDAVTSCITKAVNDWKFPRPRGGVVSVRYPFGLSLE
jgi:hypothetical protein